MKSVKHPIKKNRGFSVLEISAVLVVGSVMITSYAMLMNSRMKSAQVETTRERLDTINAAIKSYLQRENRYPTPTHLATDEEDADFGREQPCGSAVTDSIEVNGRDSNKVCIGGLPVRDLHLPDTYATDAWMGKFIYAVTKDLTVETTFDFTKGAIDIQDSASYDTLLETSGIAHYAVLSFGLDQKGSYALNGSQSICENDPGNVENCDLSQGTFYTAAYTETTSGFNALDDMAVYWPLTVNGGDIPALAIVAFDRAKCPQGWTANIWGNVDPLAAPATTERPTTKNTITGRVIVGSGLYNEPYDSEQDPFSYTYKLRETGGRIRLLLEDMYLPQHDHYTNFTTLGGSSGISIKAGTSSVSNVMAISGTTTNPSFTTNEIARPVTYADNRTPAMALHYCMKH